MTNKNLGFLVKFNWEVVSDYLDRHVHAIYVGDLLIGYISIITMLGERIFTPFTADGELPEAHCASCAAQALFAKHCGLPPDAIDAVDARFESAGATETSLEKAIALLAALSVLKSKTH